MPSHQADEQETRAGVSAHGSKFAGIPALAQKLFPAGRMRDLHDRVQRSPAGFELESLLAAMRVELRVEESDSARIPAAGPAVVVANHPFGILDAAVLAVLLTRIRPDVKLMTFGLMGDVPELARHCIFADSAEAAHSAGSDANSRATAETFSWLQRGGMLALFPAGEVSQWQLPHAEISDRAWSDMAVRLIRQTGAAALPVYICGRNSVGFHLFGKIHPRLRTAFLRQEFLQQAGHTVEVRVGSEIPGESVAGMADDLEAIE